MTKYFSIGAFYSPEHTLTLALLSTLLAIAFAAVGHNFKVNFLMIKPLPEF